MKAYKIKRIDLSFNNTETEFIDNIYQSYNPYIFEEIDNADYIVEIIRIFDEHENEFGVDETYQSIYNKLQEYNDMYGNLDIAEISFYNGEN